MKCKRLFCWTIILIWFDDFQTGCYVNDIFVGSDSGAFSTSAGVSARQELSIISIRLHHHQSLWRHRTRVVRVCLLPSWWCLLNSILVPWTIPRTWRMKLVVINSFQCRWGSTKLNTLLSTACKACWRHSIVVGVWCTTLIKHRRQILYHFLENIFQFE